MNPLHPFVNTRKHRLMLLAAIAFFLIPTQGNAVITTDKVFADPLVAQLAQAARDGDLERLQALLRAGARVGTAGREGMTVTHYALLARRHAPQVMEMLLQAGADPEVVKVLFAHSIGPNWFPPASKEYQKTSLLQEACMGHNLPVIKLLVERGADLNYIDPFSGSALHYALSGTDFFMAAYLVEAGIDLGQLNNTSPEIKNPRAIRQTAIEYFCETEGGKRGRDPLPEIAAGSRVFTMPCGL